MRYKVQSDSDLASQTFAQNAQLIIDQICKKPYGSFSQMREGIERPFHGASHLCRVAALVVVFANLYRYFCDKEALALTESQLELLQYAALFHDLGREGEGNDKLDWEKHSAENFYDFVITYLKADKAIAICLAEAIVNKDNSNESQQYHEMQVAENGDISWQSKKIEGEFQKSIFATILQNADSWDIKRVMSFKLRYTDAHNRFILNQTKKEVAQEALNLLAKLMHEHARLLHDQGDDFLDYDFSIKKKIEDAKNIYMAIEKDFTNSDRFPMLATLYAGGRLLTSEQLKKLDLRNKPYDDKQGLTNENLCSAMEQGILYARALNDPTVIISEKGRKETHGEKEFYKLLRQPHVATRSKNLLKQLGKDGNRNRSISRLYGPLFGSTGILILDSETENIQHVSPNNINSGKGRRKFFKLQSPDTVKEELYKLDQSLKCGNYDQHSEIIYNLKPEKIIAIYFCLDAKLNGRNTSRFQPILEALYLQQEYFQQTQIYRHKGDLLPIVEYSRTQHTLEIKQFTEEKILAIWIEMCKWYLDKKMSELSSSSKYYEADFATVKDLKIKALGEEHTRLSDSFSVDIYYSIELHTKINKALELVLTDAKNAMISLWLSKIHGNAPQRNDLVSAPCQLLRKTVLNMQQIKLMEMVVECYVKRLQADPDNSIDGQELKIVLELATYTNNKELISTIDEKLTTSPQNFNELKQRCLSYNKQHRFEYLKTIRLEWLLNIVENSLQFILVYDLLSVEDQGKWVEKFSLDNVIEKITCLQQCYLIEIALKSKNYPIFDNDRWLDKYITRSSVVEFFDFMGCHDENRQSQLLQLCWKEWSLLNKPWTIQGIKQQVDVLSDENKLLFLKILYLEFSSEVIYGCDKKFISLFDIVKSLLEDKKYPRLKTIDLLIKLQNNWDAKDFAEFMAQHDEEMQWKFMFMFCSENPCMFEDTFSNADEFNKQFTQFAQSERNQLLLLKLLIKNDRLKIINTHQQVMTLMKSSEAVQQLLLRHLNSLPSGFCKDWQEFLQLYHLIPKILWHATMKGYLYSPSLINSVADLKKLLLLVTIENRIFIINRYSFVIQRKAIVENMVELFTIIETFDIKLLDNEKDIIDAMYEILDPFRERLKKNLISGSLGELVRVAELFPPVSQRIFFELVGECALISKISPDTSLADLAAMLVDNFDSIPFSKKVYQHIMEQFKAAFFARTDIKNQISFISRVKEECRINMHPVLRNDHNLDNVRAHILSLFKHDNFQTKDDWLLQKYWNHKYDSIEKRIVDELSCKKNITIQQLFKQFLQFHSELLDSSKNINPYTPFNMKMFYVLDLLFSFLVPKPQQTKIEEAAPLPVVFHI